MTGPAYSIVVPVYNEEDNVPKLTKEITDVMSLLGKPYELIYVDDGSKDGSLEALKTVRKGNANIRVLVFEKNCGQSAALEAGIRNSRGEVIITLDADLQNPPEEIPKLVTKMVEGFDVVGTVRSKRKDSLFRKAASRIVNRTTGLMTGMRLND